MGRILSVRNLVVEFDTPAGVVRAVNGVDFDLEPGETLGIVGESGSGKTVTALAILDLLPRPGARIVSGEAWFGDRDLLALSAMDLRPIRGADIAMVFQDPSASLNPVFRVGRQIAEAIRAHDPSATRSQAEDRAAALLAMVGIPDPVVRLREYPHQWSGGMRQRAMIAMAIANRPRILIADEPTAALDTTVQAQVLDVLRVARRETGAATILITHDFGVLAEMADRVAVMYGGRILETGPLRSVLRSPRHPYTVGLLRSRPSLDTEQPELVSIPGSPPSPTHLPSGCPFHPRCTLARGRRSCCLDVPTLTLVDGRDHRSACHYHDELAGLDGDVHP